MSRRYPEMPVPAVGALVVQDARVLLVLRRNPPQAGRWSIPGGVQKVGETLVEAVRRELIEETGLSVTDVQLLDVGDLLEYDREGRVEYHYVITYFRCRPACGTLRAGDDAGDVRWFTPECVATLAISERLKQLVASALECEAGNVELKSQII